MPVISKLDEQVDRVLIAPLTEQLEKEHEASPLPNEEAAHESTLQQSSGPEEAEESLPVWLL